MQLKWKFRTSGPVIAQPQVDSTSVYVASKPGVLYRINQTDKKQIWRRNLGETIEEGLLLQNEMLYYGTEKGRIGAVDLAKGRDVWTQRVANESFLAQPALDEKNIYWVSKQGIISAWNKTNGQPIWRFNAESTCETTPFVTAKSVYVGCDNHALYAIDKTAGFVQWKFFAAQAIKGSPIAHNGIVLFGSEDTHFYAVHEKDGSIFWKYKSGGAIRGVPILYMDEDDREIKEVLFASFDNFLYNVRIKNGGRKWLSATSARVYNRMHFDRALIFVAPFGAALQGYDPHTGERAGDFNTQNRIRSSPMSSNDWMFLGLNNGNLLCLTRTPPPPPETESLETLLPVSTPSAQTTTAPSPELQEEEEEEEGEEEENQTQTQTQTSDDR
jgi:outer membrane protein assembly factor BamB